MSRRAWWVVVFLGVTALAVILELVAALDRDPATEPWTVLIVTYVPEEWAIALIGALLLWLPFHFIRRYRQRRNP